MTQPDLSIVAPCYNEEAALDTFFTVMREELDRLDLSWEIVCVNDGSADRTLEMLIAKTREDARIKVVNLSRNFGKEAALTAGIDHASGRAVIPMDVDLQDPPTLIKEMVALWREGYDVVNAARSVRASDSFAKRSSAGLFYKYYNKLATRPIPADVGDFRLLDRRVVDVLKQMPERNRFMKGLFSWPGFRQTQITYERPPRLEGETKFNFWKLWNLALDGIFSFSTIPLRIWTYIGLATAMAAFCYASWLIVRTLIFGADVPGYASLMVMILFLGGVQLISLGIIGEYLGRVYDEAKQRPIYLVENVYSQADAEARRPIPIHARA